MQKIKSPDNLDEYIRVANPGVWTLMVTIILLLAGFCVWTVFGTIKTTINTDVVCENNVITCYLSQEEANKVSIGMSVEIGEYSGNISEIIVQSENIVCRISTADTIPNGIYDAVINIEAIHPASFLTN